MKFSVYYGTVGETLIAVGEQAPYATLVLPGDLRRKLGEPLEVIDDLIEDDPDIEEAPISAGGKQQKNVKTRRQLEALKPGAVTQVLTKRGFLELLRADDLVCMPAGGLGAIFAQRASAKAKVLQIPTFKLAEERREAKLDAAEPQVVIAEVHRLHPDLFRPIPAEDRLKTELRILTRSRLTVMGDYRKPAEQRMDRMLEDLTLLAPEDKHGAAVRREWAVHLLLRKPFEQLAREEERLKLIGAVLDEVRKQTGKGTGLKLPTGLSEAEKEVTRGLREIKIEREALEENPIGRQARTAEAELKSEIARLLDRIPIYEQVFAQIPGLGSGSVTAAAILSEIYDIRRFSASDRHLGNYAGWGFEKGGSRQRRHKGTVANWNDVLKQAFYQWAEFVVKSARNLIVRSDAPVELGTRVEFDGAFGYRVVGPPDWSEDTFWNEARPGLPVTNLKQVELEALIEDYRAEQAKLVAKLEKEEDQALRADLAECEKLLGDLLARVERGETAVRLATVATNYWRAYYDLKRRVLLSKHPQPVEHVEVKKVRGRDGVVRDRETKRWLYTPSWIDRTARAKCITQLIDVIWTLWMKADAPELWRARHEARHARYQAWLASETRRTATG